ncbi:Palmitoyl-protein thioesterase 1 [Cladophialophora carrionii]|uniref:Palmitoyl-protein thioesterase 1 n=1 Tax=Cladophialophora carrionii TaxID=86049 RepID=A0A1C1D093_9EURO|nr:Palmitoyl-protein thioesterase 1 [Cladophialophora carrionii]
MRTTQLSMLLSLPAAILAFVVFPEAEVFRNQPADVPNLSPKGRVIPQVIREEDNGLEAPTSSDTVEEIIADEWVKITKLSPKCAFRATSLADDTDDQPLPVVIWHGLGDSANAEGLKEVAAWVDEVNPGTYTYMITVGANAGSADRQASFFGNVTQQIDSVCHALAKDNILRTAPAIDALGFSQGGLFLRGYVERCNRPKVRSLITFGSPHNGIAEFQKCSSPTDWICQGANALLKSSTVWSDFIQSRLVPAQYYRDTKDFENYLEHSNYLADINNERALKNVSYADNLSQLERFVMILFNNDTTLIPKESAWFAEFNETENSVTPLRLRPIYREDWIGLKRLDKKGGLKTVKLPGEHMRFSDKDLKKLFKSYFGPEGRPFDDSMVFESAKMEEETLRPWRSAGYRDEEL